MTLSVFHDYTKSHLLLSTKLKESMLYVFLTATASIDVDAQSSYGLIEGKILILNLEYGKEREKI
jgi:hypothetical protein